MTDRVQGPANQTLLAIAQDRQLIELARRMKQINQVFQASADRRAGGPITLDVLSVQRTQGTGE